MSDSDSLQNGKLDGADSLTRSFDMEKGMYGLDEDTYSAMHKGKARTLYFILGYR